MNKIILENDKIINVETDSSLTYELISNDMLGVNLLKIEVLKDTNLELNYNFFNSSKLEISIIINENVNLNIYEQISGKETKIRTKYILKENSNVKISKFNDIETIKEYVIIYLDGKYSNIKYNLKTISKQKEKYDILIYHNNIETNSEIIANGVNIKDGILTFNVSSFVPQNNKNCNASQNNRIINLTDNQCIIKPNLYIDEYEVSANHSALIGNFDERELFYLESRGINKNDAMRLLIKGFLTSNLEITEQQKEEIINKIDTYWR